MSKAIKILVLAIVCLSFFLSGCYRPTAVREMNDAERSLSQLRTAGGQAKVPYEFTSAEKFLDLARMEAGENDYKHALDFARRSKAASQAGLAGVQGKR